MQYSSSTTARKKVRQSLVLYAQDQLVPRVNVDQLDHQEHDLQDQPERHILLTSLLHQIIVLKLTRNR
jgi:hypothetical protein